MPRIRAIDGYRSRARAAAIMHGLGFKTADHPRPVAEFSGGWRVRLANGARTMFAGRFAAAR